ncbi:glucose-6-phosphate isomerase [Nematocida minor]|uniref:glucose-6-phosphate isomerase n=1 Tax=Nematocida minor TaxID=1912983 RepID=UPI0022200934|nr:glucose-6-phosphate isomerase [Nematocida minor]KAI5191756.1 glucose-6-phosphate isomerase [Nematocida minor]
MKEIKDLFKDTDRVKKLVKVIESNRGSVLVDYTKTHIEDSDISEWVDRLEKMSIAARVKSMFAGEKINYTENRQVLHVKLRSMGVIEAVQSGAQNSLDKEEKEIVAELQKMKSICNGFESGKMKGASGKQIKNVIGVGIGGSDLGPRLLTSAVAPAAANVGKQFRYVSNVDSQEMHAALTNINLEETVFVIVSKTFTTQETLENAKIAVSTLLSSYPKSFDRKDIIKSHFLAVTASKEKAVEFGIEEENILDMWDYVGGRYSIWSCVSLTSAMSIGFDAFLEFLRGAADIDTHFLNTPVAENIPMLHAMVECKYINEYGYNNKCIVPYDYYMKLFSSYLQQCEMESNGKSFTKTGNLLISAEFSQQGVIPGQQTAPIIWGTVGTDSQHSYFQLLHQGTIKTLSEFLIPVNPRAATKRKNTEGTEGSSTAHDVLISNCLAQSRALMMGKESEEGDRYFSGNRPSITIMYDTLTSYTLGMLIAIYEHKIFVQGQVWDINSYDQFGVELGKVLAKEILSKVEKNVSALGFDPSTDVLMGHYQQKKK